MLLCNEEVSQRKTTLKAIGSRIRESGSFDKISTSLKWFSRALRSSNVEPASLSLSAEISFMSEPRSGAVRTHDQ